MDIEDFVAFSSRECLAPRDGAAPQECLEAFLDDLLEMLVRGGCKVVGHIKGMMTCGKDKPLFFSITSIENNLRFQGGPLGESDSFILTMNVIVSGIDENKLEETFSAALGRHFVIRLKPDYS